MTDAVWKVWQRNSDGHWLVEIREGKEGACFATRKEAEEWAWAKLNVQKPEKRYDWLICPWCGDKVDAEDAVRVRFELNTGTDVGMDVCKGCQSAQPCRGNITGIHGEVYDGDYDGARPGLPFEPDGQHGWCSRCSLPMIWSVERQRWVDYPGELTPTGRLARAMDARDRGQLTDDEFDQAVAEALRV